jgi:hypothetical protein
MSSNERLRASGISSFVYVKAVSWYPASTHRPSVRLGSEVVLRVTKTRSSFLFTSCEECAPLWFQRRFRPAISSQVRRVLPAVVYTHRCSRVLVNHSHAPLWFQRCFPMQVVCKYSEDSPPWCTHRRDLSDLCDSHICDVSLSYTHGANS